jgi:hypothetical protein
MPIMSRHSRSRSRNDFSLNLFILLFLLFLLGLGLFNDVWRAVYCSLHTVPIPVVSFKKVSIRRKLIIHLFYPSLTASRLLLVELGQILDILLAAQEHRAPLMNARRHDVKDTPSPSDGHTPSLLSEHRHRESLVQNAQLSVLALLVIGIPEDTTI